MDKRGVSTLIAVVLLILITVAAIGIVWQIVIPLAKQSTETTEKCQAASLEINKKSFYNVSSGQASILVSRGAPVIGTETAELTAIQIKVTSDTDDSKTVTINASQTALPKINEDKLYVINLGGLIGSSFKVEVAPVVEVNEKDRLCSMTKEHTLNYIGTPQTCLYTCCAGNEICIGTWQTTSDCSTECCDGTCCIDFDSDTYASDACGGNDCNDTNPGINPGATEICGNGIDEDCSGADLPCVGNTCSDLGGVECCDGVNYLCVGINYSGASDCVAPNVCCSVPCCIDSDSDTYASDACGGNDCNDTNSGINPGAIEICGNGVDEDCSGTDETCPTCPEGLITTRCNCGGVIYESGYCCAGSYQTDPCVAAGWQTPTAIYDKCGEYIGVATGIIDDNTSTYWRHDTHAENHSIAFDMGQAYTITKVRVYHASYMTGVEPGAIYVSDDPNNWGSSLGSSSANYNSPAGWDEIDIIDKSGRYINITANSNTTVYWYEFDAYID